MATQEEYITAKTLRDDLREVYLLSYDSFAIDPGEVIDSVPSITNTRYARELLGILTNQKILAVADGDNGDIWQTLTPGTPDEITRETAESFIDKWLDTAVPLPDYNPNHDTSNTDTKESKIMSTATATKTKPAATTTDFRKCGCGCDENVSGKALYKPGHDARHAGQVARQILTVRPESKAARDALLDVLPTDALINKASALADLWIAKADAKVEREKERADRAAAKAEAKAAKTPEWTDIDPVKVGKTEYPARQHRDGHVERNSKKDGSGNWLPVKSA